MQTDDIMTILACQLAVPTVETVEQRDQHVSDSIVRIEKFLSAESSDLVLLPELATISYSRSSFSNLAETAEDLHGPSINAFADLARRFNCHVAFGMPRVADDGFRISHVIVGTDGVVKAIYDKIHLAHYGASMEKDYFVPGNTIAVVNIAGFRVATAICYDLRFPELFRRLSIDERVDVILHPVAYPFDFTFPSYHNFVSVRALENLVYMVSLNRSVPDSRGPIPDESKWIGSIFCPPNWPQEASTEIFGDGEEFRRLTIKREALNQARQSYPFMQDRRNDYSDLESI